jgi:pyruvate formate lyase activating enzyme
MPLCSTCPHSCDLAEGQLGLCRARRASEGHVIPDSYGRVTSLALDPIEKKPIARWNSGKTVLSLGGYGCNMRCPFCQNASIAQVGAADVSWREYTPKEIINIALDLVKRA